MAFSYCSNDYYPTPIVDGDNDFSGYLSYDSASNRSYSDNSDSKLLESQFFGYDRLRRPGDSENALPYASSDADFYWNHRPVTYGSTDRFDEDKWFFGGYGYNHPPPNYHYASYCAYTQAQSTIAYSASPFYESKSFEIDPSRCDPHDPYVTRFVVSYSAVEFNEPDYEEYDPTPYGGGYDLSSAYGKPLPPSGEICYPKDSAKVDPQVPVPGDTIAIPEEISVSGPGKETDHEEDQPTSKHDEGEPKPLVSVPEIKKQDEPKLVPVPEVENQEEPKLPLVPVMEAERQGDNTRDAGVYGDRPLVANSQMFPPAPPGFGLDALDLCESLFGYWPCLARDARRGHCCPQEYNYGSGSCIQRNEWEGAANYLFGGPDPYYRDTSGGRYDA